MSTLLLTAALLLPAGPSDDRLSPAAERLMTGGFVEVGEDVEVELVAVGDDEDHWWRPDGEPVSFDDVGGPPALTGGGVVPREPNVVRQFVFRASRLGEGDEGDSIAMKGSLKGPRQGIAMSGTPTFDGVTPKAAGLLAVSVAPDATSGRVEIYVGLDRWTTVGAIDSGGSVSLVSSCDDGGGTATVVMTNHEAAGDSGVFAASVSVRCGGKNALLKNEYHMIALDADGQSLDVDFGRTMGTGVMLFVTGTDDRVARYELQTRARETFTFDDVRLRPNEN